MEVTCGSPQTDIVLVNTINNNLGNTIMEVTDAYMGIGGLLQLGRKLWNLCLDNYVRFDVKVSGLVLLIE